MSNERSLWESKIPRNQLPFRVVTKVTLISSKGIHLGTPEERNKPLSVACNCLLFWNPTNPSKGLASLYPPEVFRFISAHPSHPGSYYFFKEGDYKNEFTRRGGPFSDPPPSFLYPFFAGFAKEFDLQTCAGRDFLTLKKAHLRSSRAIIWLLSTQFFTDAVFPKSLSQTVLHKYRTSLSGALRVEEETGITKKVTRIIPMR
jgi:hypothetical protein